MFHEFSPGPCQKQPPKPRSWRNQNFKTFPIKCLTVKMQPPKPRSCQKLAKSIFQYFFQGKKNRKKQRIENLFFLAFGKILVLANVFSIQILISNSIEKLIFPALGKILASVNDFFSSNSN